MNKYLLLGIIICLTACANSGEDLNENQSNNGSAEETQLEEEMSQEEIFLAWAHEAIDSIETLPFLIDMDSFEEINSSFAKDKERVYYLKHYFEFVDKEQAPIRHSEIEILEEGEPDSFKVIDYPYYYGDDDSVFYLSGTNDGGVTHTLEGADPNTFELLDTNQEGVYFHAQDANSGYIKYVPVNPNDFEVLNNYYASDGNHIFHKIAYSNIWPEIFEDADPETFTIAEGPHATDENYVYTRCLIYEGLCITQIDADSSSYEYLSNGFWRIQDAVFQYTNEIEGADPNTFKSITVESNSSGYSLGSDDEALYVVFINSMERFEGIDIESFEIISTEEWSQLEAKDKNNHYQFTAIEINEFRGLYEIEMTILEE